MGLEGYGLEPGCHADLVVLAGRRSRSRRSASSPPACTWCARGRVIAETPPVMATLYMQQAPEIVDFRNVQY